MSKKDGLRIVDMCIYIDENIYKDNYDELKIFDYLKTIAQSLALHKKYFKNIQDYEPFSLYVATRIFLRLINKRQFLPDNDKHKLEKVKSVLNLMKKLLYPCKVEYQNSAYNDVIKEEFEDTRDLYNQVKSDLIHDVMRTQQGVLTVDINIYLRQLKKCIWNVIDTTPYCNDFVIKSNLYMSILLSFLRSITISNKNKVRISTSYVRSNSKIYEEMLNSIYKIEQETAPVLWHLDKNFLDYVRILLIRVQEQIIYDIQELQHYQIPSEDFITEILMQPLKEIEND